MTATMTEPRTTAGSSATTITIARQALRTALSRLSGAVGTGMKALPVTQHVRLDIAPGRLTLTATDFDAWAKVTLPCDASGATIALLPAKRLTEIVGALPPVGAVTIVLKDGSAVLTAGRTRFELAGLPVEEFPSEPDVMRATNGERSEVNGLAFVDAMERIVSHASAAESRPAITVVRLEPDGEDGIRVAAIEGAHAGRLRLPATGAAIRACSVHRLGVPVLARLFSGLTSEATLAIAATGSQLLVESDDASALVRLVDMDFPTLEPTLKSLTVERVVVCDRVLLSAAIRRVALVTDETNRVTIELAEEITIRATSDTNRSADVVAIDERRVDRSHDPRRFALNASFALTALETIAGPRVAIAFSAPSRAILFTDADQAPDDPALVLLMPLRLLD